MKEPYKMRYSAEYELRHFIDTIEYLADKNKIARDKDKLIDILADGIINFEDVCRNAEVRNTSTSPVIHITNNEFIWIITEYKLGNPFAISNEFALKGYCILGVDRPGTRYIKDFLIVVIDPDLVVKNMSGVMCEIINDLCRCGTDIVPTKISTEPRSAWNIFMKLLTKGSWGDLLDTVIGTNTRHKRLRKWMLKNGYAEITLNK